MTLKLDSLMTSERLDRGYAIVLPGIEGFSRWNRKIVQGLVDAGVPCAIEIHDWTHGRFWSLYTLRDRRRHVRQAEEIAGRIAAYRERQPHSPVWLIGHSGGGAMAVLSLERLADNCLVDGAVMLGPALSPAYNLEPALSRTRRGIWNISSRGDLLFLAVGTLLFGTIDGRHSFSAGAFGFRRRNGAAAAAVAPGPALTEIPWRLSMVRHGHWGGHFGYVHPRFVASTVAPLLTNPATDAEA